MGLMRALQGVATGYLDARVGQFETAAKAKADKKALDDKYKAEETMRINTKNNELTKTAELKALEDAEDKNKRFESALALGFTPEFLGSKGEYMLSSQNNFDKFIEMGQKKYKKITWWKDQIVFGDYEGQTVQDYLLKSNTKTFDGKKVKGDTKERANISDAIADNQMQEEDKKTDVPKFSGSDLFFKKASYATDAGSKYVNQSGNLIHGYRIEQDYGEKNWGTQIYFDSIDQETNEMKTSKLPVTFFEASSETGQSFIKQNSMFFNSMEQNDYMVKFEGKYHRISGTTKKYDGREDEVVIDGLSPYVVELLGLDLSKTSTTLPPMANTETKVQYHEFNKKDWDAVTNGKLELIPYDKTEFFNTNKLGENFRGNINPSSMKSYVNNALAMGGFIENEDYTGFNFNQIEGGGYDVQFSTFGDNDAQKAAKILTAVTTDTFDKITNNSRMKQKYGDSRGDINSLYVEELGFETNDPNLITNEQISTKVGLYYKKIKDREGKRNLEILKSLSEGRDNTKLLEFLESNRAEDLLIKITDGASLATVAQNLTDRQLTELKSLDELIDFNKKVEDMETKAVSKGSNKISRQESQLINNVFPESEKEMGNTLENFVDYYVTDATDSEDGVKQSELLRVAIDGITDSEEQRDALVARVGIYLDEKEKQQLINKRITGNILTEVDDSSDEVGEQDVNASIKSTAQSKDEDAKRKDAVEKLKSAEKEIENAKLEIANLIKNSKNASMLETVLAPKRQALINLQRTAVQYEQDLQIINQGFATKEKNLLEKRIEDNQ